MMVTCIQRFVYAQSIGIRFMEYKLEWHSMIIYLINIQLEKYIVQYMIIIK